MSPITSSSGWFQDAKDKIEPALAESWKTVNDLTWEFKLRKGVKWHDGFGIHRRRRRRDRQAHPVGAEQPGLVATYTRPIKSIDAIDKYTRAHSDRTYALPAACGPCGDPHRAGEERRDCKDRGLSIAARPWWGPDRIATRNTLRAIVIVLERNDGYWGRSPIGRLCDEDDPERTGPGGGAAGWRRADDRGRAHGGYRHAQERMPASRLPRQFRAG